ncbi:MAG: DUF1826 domain-containing protein [Lentisphaeraceae bacterium]|nr:DUF1826 domain-containing protein [Lentisphaeraceae bacterium]
MFAVAESNGLSYFNLTEESELFNNPQVGAMYFPPEENFSEIDQQTLKLLVKENQKNPLPGYKDYHFEFFPKELFIETAFDSVLEAEKYIYEVFDHFGKINKAYRDSIISRLRTFTKMVQSSRKLHCRFEILSGNSCKRFHVDSVSARLIYTCAGPGTQIKLPDEDKFITLPSGSVLIAKGEEYPNFRAVTLHRSPPIEGTNIKRFVFIADYQ